MINDERSFWVAWSQIRGVGSVLLRRLQQHFGTLAAAWEATPEELARVEGLGDRKVEGIVSGRSQLDLDRFLEKHQQKNPHFWTPADAEYPPTLLAIPNPPAVLYYLGNADFCREWETVPHIAIVGTRNATEYGKRWTRRLSSVLTQRGFTIVSGMAAGIDRSAHLACLDAGGKTIAVFGTGVDVVYPSSNRSLYETILDRGLILSEYPAGTSPHRSHFPQRNRIVAGLSRAVIVTEAPKGSGALITADFARDFDRQIDVLPSSLDNPNAIGSLELLNKGAKAILGEEQLLQLLSEFPLTGQVSKVIYSPPVTVPQPSLEPELDRVFQIISIEPISFDSIVAKVGSDAGSISAILIQLELLGLIAQLPGMFYRRC
ncbi:MAG TPA: DNA-protecting protein DprA [Oscillatoriales cyanobacterium M59_W2019_021]|nr:DNA-protecting protein DprA [Oscillatoriales cyanobacterium M59_W2019_021]